MKTKNVFLSIALAAFGSVLTACGGASQENLDTGQSFPQTEREAIVDMLKKEKDAFNLFQSERTGGFSLDYDAGETKIEVEYDKVSYSSTKNEYSAPATIQWKQKAYFLTLEYDVVIYSGNLVLYEKRDGHVFVEFFASKCNEFARKCDKEFCETLENL